MTIQTGSHLFSINGMEMYCEISGEGRPLVLLHAFSGTSSDWHQVFQPFPERFQCIIPDLRGHGRSTNPSGRFTHRQAALDVFALLDQLGIDEFKAIGMSTGAKTLLHMATGQPGRIETMVLVSGTHYFPPQTRDIMARFSVKDLSEQEWQTLRQRHKHGDEQIRALYRQGNAFKDNYDDMNFTPPFLGTITARTLIVHGDRDPFYPVEIPFELYRSLPRAALWIVPNSGHIPIFGARAARFVETAVAFLEEKGQVSKMKNGSEYSIRPIGVIRSSLKTREAAPKQGNEGAPDAWIDVEPSFAEGLDGIRKGMEIIVITWLHRSSRDMLKVHPRGDRNNPLTGVFATRSPHRPNPLGLHRVTVLEISDNRLKVGPLEAIDGTPVVDIKHAMRSMADS